MPWGEIVIMMNARRDQVGDGGVALESREGDPPHAAHPPFAVASLVARSGGGQGGEDAPAIISEWRRCPKLAARKRNQADLLKVRPNPKH